MCPKKIITRFISRCQLWFSRIKQRSPTSLVVSSLPESCLLPGHVGQAVPGRSSFDLPIKYRYHNGYSGEKKMVFHLSSRFHLFPTKMAKYIEAATCYTEISTSDALTLEQRWQRRSCIPWPGGLKKYGWVVHTTYKHWPMSTFYL